MAEDVGAIFSIVVSVVLIAAITAFIYAFVRELRRDTLEIDGISAPRAISERGFTSAVIAGSVLSEFSRVEDAATTMRGHRQLEAESAIPDIQVASSGLSMKSLVRYGRRLFGVPTHQIDGEILQDTTGLRMVLRVIDGPHVQEASVRRADGDVEALLHDGGQALVQLVDPYVLASYRFGNESVPGSTYAQTLAAIDYTLAHGPASDAPWAYNLLGLVRASQGDDKAAIAAYQHALALDPAQEVVGGNYVQALMREGRDSDAHAFVERRTAAAHTLRDYEQVISMNMDIGRFGTAVSLELRALGIRPDDPVALSMLPESLYYAHRPTEALHWAEVGVARAPQLVVMRLNRGATLALNGRFDEAIAQANEVEADARANGQLSTLADVTWLRGFIELRRNRYPEAMAAYRAAIAGGDTDAMVPEQSGDAELAMGHPAEAAAWYRRALQIQPTGLDMAGLARADLQLGHADEALALFAKAAALDPDNVELLRDWAAALDQAGQAERAATVRREIPKAQARLAEPLAP